MTPPTGLSLSILPGRLAVVRLVPGDPLPAWAAIPAGPLWSVTRTAEEVSVVTEDGAVLDGHASAERGWRALKVAGPLDFALTGVLASLAGPLAAAGISLFAVSTFDTDYVLVKANRLPDAVAALHGAGHAVTGEDV